MKTVEWEITTSTPENWFALIRAKDYSMEQFYCEFPLLPLFVFHLGIYKYKRGRQRQRQKTKIRFSVIE